MKEIVFQDFTITFDDEGRVGLRPFNGRPLPPQHFHHGSPEHNAFAAFVRWAFDTDHASLLFGYAPLLSSHYRIVDSNSIQRPGDVVFDRLFPDTIAYVGMRKPEPLVMTVADLEVSRTDIIQVGVFDWMDFEHRVREQMSTESINANQTL